MPGLITINTAPNSTRLTSLSTAKAELNVTASADDSYILTLIDRASSIIGDHCGLDAGFGVIGATETFRFGTDFGIGPASQQVAPYGTPLNVRYKPLILQYRPVVTLANDGIVENGVTLDGSVPDWEVDAKAGLVYRIRQSARSWWNVPTVTVTYTAGYVMPGDTGTRTLPAAVEDVCLALVKSAYTSRGFDPSVVMDWTPELGRTQYQRTGSGTMTLDDGLRAQLTPYMQRVH